MTESKHLVIGLTGKKRSGKSTVSEYLVENYGYVEHAMAKSLKAGCQALFGFSDAQCHDPELKEKIDPYWGCSPREAFVTLGGLMRERFPYVPTGTFWVRRAAQLLEEEIKSEPIVFCDIRYPEEADLIRSHGGEIWRIERIAKEEISSRPERERRLDRDSSETEMDGLRIDRALLNVGDLQALYERVDRIMAMRGEPKTRFLE